MQPSSGGAEPHSQLTDDQLQRLIMKAYEDSPDLAQLQLSMRGVMLADPERIRQAYRQVVQLKGRARSRASSEQQPGPTPWPSLTLVEPGGAGAAAAVGANSGKQRASQRRKSNPAQQRSAQRKSSSEVGALTAQMDASAFREASGGLDNLRSELAALCRVRHQNLLCLTAARPGKAGRFTLDFDLGGSASHVTLLDLFRDAALVDGPRCQDGCSLNACEIACVLAQACLGLLFLTECASAVLRNLLLRPEACLLTKNILLTNSGVIKLCGHHPVLQLPRTAATWRAQDETDEESDDFLDVESDSGRGRPGQLAHRLAQLLYELDHVQHRQLHCLADCPPAERELLDKRYAQLFGLCSDWDATRPVDLRFVLYSNFISEQTSSLDSFQAPLEIVFASRLG